MFDGGQFDPWPEVPQGEPCLLCKRRFAPALLATHFARCFDGYCPVKRQRQCQDEPAASEAHSTYERAQQLIPGLGARSVALRTAQSAIAYLNVVSLCALDATSRAWRACVTPHWRRLLERAWAVIDARAADSARMRPSCTCFRTRCAPTVVDGEGTAPAKGAKSAALRLGALLSLQSCTVLLKPFNCKPVRPQHFTMQQRTFPGALFYTTVYDLECIHMEGDGGGPLEQMCLIKGGRGLLHEFASLLAYGFDATTRVEAILALPRSGAHARHPNAYYQLVPLVRKSRTMHEIPNERLLSDPEDLGPLLALCFLR